MAHARPLIVLALLAGAAAGPATAGAQAPTDTASVVVRLGTDTIAVERWVRTGDGLEATHVARSPRAQLRRYSLRFDAEGRPTRVATGTDDAPLQERDVAPPGAVPMFGGLYAPWAVLLHEAWRTGGAEAGVPMLAGAEAQTVAVRRAAPGVYELENQFAIPMTARLDERGRLVELAVEGGTAVERVTALDLDAIAGAWRAQDERGEGMGPLSPRETVEGSVDGTRVAVAYGRPSARGRPVWGGLVPYGEVWRTGANEETLLTLGGPVRLGDLDLEAGTYSLFTVPGPDAWELIVSRQTGQGGLGYDPAHDVGRVRMQARTLDAPVERFTIAIHEDARGGALSLAWERLEARVPIRPAGSTPPVLLPLHLELGDVGAPAVVAQQVPHEVLGP